jgi:hypothetical protein
MGADVGVGVKVRVDRIDVGGAGVCSKAALASASAETASMAGDVRFDVRLAVMPSSIRARLYKPGATSPSSRHARCDHVWRWHEPRIEPLSATAMRKMSRNPWPVTVKPSESFRPDRLSIAGGRNTPNCTSPVAISTSCQSVTRCRPAGMSAGTRSASSSLATNVAEHGTDGEPSEQVKRAAREKPWPSKRTVMLGTATSGSTAEIETAVAEATQTHATARKDIVGRCSLGLWRLFHVAPCNLEPLTTHRTQTRVVLAAHPLVNAVHVKRVLALAPHGRALVARILAVRAEAVKRLPTDAAVAVVDLPLPRRHTLPA